MSTTHRIVADWHDDTFVLLAIHSPLEDYALAYALNRACDLRLKRTKNDSKDHTNATFPAFEWEDSLNDRYWKLVANRGISREKMHGDGFFVNHATFRTCYLVNKQKAVNYFLGIDSIEKASLELYMRNILSIPSISGVYTTTLKLKKNIIF